MPSRHFESNVQYRYKLSKQLRWKLVHIVTKTMKSDNIMVHLAEAIEGGDKGGSYT